MYQTARTDLLNLTAAGLLEARRVSNRWHFIPFRIWSGASGTPPADRHKGTVQSIVGGNPCDFQKKEGLAGAKPSRCSF